MSAQKVTCRYCDGRGQVNWEQCDECDNGTLLLTPASVDEPPRQERAGERGNADA